MPSIKYPFPKFLNDICTEKKYLRWLSAKSQAHVCRDKRRGSNYSINEHYKVAIHQAVLLSKGFDFYTGKKLDWHLIGTYDNTKSKKGKRRYKYEFQNLPTVDHVNDVNGKLEVRICSWKVNDAKSDMTLKEFVDLCKNVVKHNSK